MKRLLIVLMPLALLMPMAAGAQKVDPLVYYTLDSQVLETKSIDDGEAPLEATFRANPEDMGEWTPSFEWHFYKTEGNEERREIVVRYEEDTQYTFTESGTYQVVLKTRLSKGSETAELDDEQLKVVIVESKLEFPNAFSPNGDGKNDIYRAKEGYKSIVSFKAIIFNRWGQKLYEWDNPAGGWDGTHNGHDVKQGVYFVLVKAKGADGREYNIRKDVNLLRGFTEKGSMSNE